MKHGAPTILALALVTGLTLPSWLLAAPDPVLYTNAQLTTILNRGATFTGSTPMTIAYSENFHQYYGALGGNTTYSGFTWDKSGVLLLTTTPLNVDYRGIVYNPSTGGIEVVTYSAQTGGTAGLYAMGVDGAGRLNGSNTQLLGAMSGLPDVQSAPAYDPARDVFYARAGSNIVNIVGHADGLLKGTITLNMAAAGSATLLGEVVGYDSSYEVFVTVDTLGNRALVHRRDGSYLGACNLPNFTPQQVNWNMGYANGQVFVFDLPTNEWWGYRIFGPRTVTLASTSALNYSLLSTSVVANDNTTATVLNSQLGTPDTLQWRFGHWIPDKAAFSMAGPFYTSIGRELTTIDVGQGYWLATKSPKAVSMTGTPVASGFETVLKDGPGGPPGWNQLGNPLFNGVPVSGLRVRSGSTSKLLTDPTNTLTDHVIWVWNGSGYTSFGSGTTLPAGSGFWLRKVAAGDVRLVFEGPGAGSAPAAPALAAPLWDVTLTARQGESSSTPLTLGVANGARDAASALAMALPPSPPGRFLRLVARAPEQGSTSDDLASEYVSLGEPTSWDFRIGGGDAPGEIQLQLDGRDVPPDVRFSLIDVAEGTTWNLEVGGSVTLIATPAERTLRLIAHAEGDAPAAQARSSVRPYPNPFVRSVGLAIRMPQSSDVRIAIFDLRGRRVRTLERARAPIGEDVIVWDGRDESGSEAPPGLYFARCSVAGETVGARIVKTR